MPEQQLLFSFTAVAPALEPSDAAERARALHPQKSFIVQAPAGSGKTELLIQRYLTLLARASTPEAVVAITFTIKAAAEMRSRVIDALESANGPEPEQEHELLTWNLARAVLDHDRRESWSLLRNASRMRIQTIDALSMAIVRQMPWTARMGAMPNVTEDARRLYEHTAENTIRLLAEPGAYGDAVETLLRHLDFNTASACTLLASMLEIRDHWMHVIGVNPDLPKVRRQLESTLASISHSGANHLRDSLAPDEAAELLVLARATLESARDLEVLPSDARMWRGLEPLLLTSGHDLRKRAPDFASAVKDRLERLLLRLHKNPTFKAAIESLKSLPDPDYATEQWELLSALFTLLPRAVAELRVTFGERSIVDFTEISQAALRALGTQENPTDLALALGHRIEHLLIDEFQDTSRTQDTLVRALTAGWDAGDGRTLFLVGDPMQSIYRFRQADVGLFLSMRERGLAGLPLAPLTLAVNFRSRRNIVDWINTAFESAFPTEENALLGAVPFSPSQAFRETTAGAGVFIHPLFNRQDEQETAETVRLIEAAQNSGESVAVLVRSRTHLLQTAARLRERGIRFRAIEIDSLGRAPVVQDLLALTRALLHLADRPAWLAILRAPWCGLTLAELETVAADPATTVWDQIRRPDASLPRLAPVQAVLAAALNQRGRITLRRLVEGAWTALNGPACLASDAALADAAAYLDLLEREESAGDLPDFTDFARKVSDLFAAPDPVAPETLELMTIHKAKGLEFDQVIIPGIGRGTKQDEPKLLLWSERENGEVMLAPISPRRGDKDPTYRFLSAEERQKAEYETVRLLYVACTRARSVLHLIGHANRNEEGITKPETGSFLKVLWPTIREHYEQPQAPQAPTVQEKQPPPLRRLKQEDLPIRQTPSAVGPQTRRTSSDQPAATTANAIGTITHRLLDRIAKDGVSFWNAERIRAARPQIEFGLRAEAIPAEELSAAAGTVEQALTRTLEDKQGRWILSPHLEAASEYAVVAVIDNAIAHLQIDRTFIDEAGTRWIIDYKIGSPTGADEHWPQLERYAKVLQEFDERPIRLALYYPLSATLLER